MLSAIAVYYVGSNLIDAASCDGFNVINPFCWMFKLADTTLTMVSFFVALVMFVAGLMLLTVDDFSELKWYFAFITMLVLFALSVFLSDPIPVIDEVLTGLLTALFGFKLIKNRAEEALGMNN